MAKNKEDRSFSPTINNRKAKHEYTFLDIYEAGIVLNGTEIKSVREAKVQFTDAFCAFQNDELYLLEMHISPYDFGTIFNTDPRRPRKLLLSRKELRKLKEKSEEKGLTIIPVKLYFNERNMAKVQIALAKGKKLFDKRQDIKDKDIDRQVKRELNES
jgi:SsrA-binding protein